MLETPLPQRQVLAFGVGDKSQIQRIRRSSYLPWDVGHGVDGEPFLRRRKEGRRLSHLVPILLAPLWDTIQTHLVWCNLSSLNRHLTTVKCLIFSLLPRLLIQSYSHPSQTGWKKKPYFYKLSTNHTIYSPERVWLPGIAGAFLSTFTEKELVWKGAREKPPSRQFEENWTGWGWTSPGTQ